MTKKNLIIVIILLSIIDLVALGWYMSRRIEASGKSQNLFEQRDSTEVIAMADTVSTASQADVFEKEQDNTYYYIADNPNIPGDESSYYTSIKHVKVRWPKKINGNDELDALNKELIKKAFGNSQSKMKDARYVYPVYGNVAQVLVYPYMTSQRLLVMEIDKLEYNGSSDVETNSFIHYDRQNQRILSRLDILMADMEKENKLLKLINNKIDELNKGRGDENRLQHALNVPAEICCRSKGILFLFGHGIISSNPIEILVEYDKIKPFLTKEFELLVDNNEGFWVYKEVPKPEPINAKPKVIPTTTPVKPVQSTAFKPEQTKQKKYSGAKRRSGRYGRAGKRHWSRRRR